MPYTGSIPSAPAEGATDAAWHNWWTYQTIAGNARYEDERAAAITLAAARAVITDKQHADKLLAEAACAAAQRDLAAAMREAVVAQALPLPVTLPTRAQLVFAMVREQPQSTVLTPSIVVKGAADIVAAYVAAYPGSVQP